MTNSLKRALAPVFIFLATIAMAYPSNLDMIGVTVLHAMTTNLNGAGIRVGQAEASTSQTDPTVWEVNPGAAGQPTNRFTYFYSSSPYLTVQTAGTFTNSLGRESGHADFVAEDFYGIPGGVATNVAHVDNYDAETFIEYYISGKRSISDRVVNQSFTFGTNDASADQLYDNYAAANNVLFISGAGFDGRPVYTPATCYNGIGVGVAGIANSPYGPTPDGRCKPDIIAPGVQDNVTSYTTPQVSGVAAILMQAALRGDGGGETNSAADIRTIKALLLNGAVKPANWTNSNSSPLDFRYGAGVLNVFNSYEQLVGGKHNFISSEMISSGGTHLPDNSTGTISNLNGWDFNSISSSSGGIFSPAQDGVNHYYFDVTNDSANATFAATITLVWNRQQNQSDINNLDLFLYDCANSNLVMCSTSLVDNVEHIFLPKLPQGRYDLQVLKSAGNSVSDNETYALAWEFFSQNLSAKKSGTNLVLRWPVYPDEFAVESATNLISPEWNPNNLPAPIFTNRQNVVFLDATNAVKFFRLRQP